MRVIQFVLVLSLAWASSAGLTRGDESWWEQRPQAWRRRDKPILSATTSKQTWCKVVCYSPHVIHHAGLYRMWYLGTSTASRSNDISMGYAESQNGIDWTEHPDNPILTGDDVSWGEMIQTPYVLWDDQEQTFKLWFVSGGVDRDEKRNITRNEQRLGYATSENGIAWKIHPEPIYPSARSPAVIKQGANRYRMWMGSRPDIEDHVSSDLYKNIYEFASTDGIRWERSDHPVIRPSDLAQTTVYPFVVQHAAGYRMWYGCHTPGKFELFFAASKDGSNWELDHRSPAFPARAEQEFFDSRYTSTPCVVAVDGRYLLYYSARDMNSTYVDSQGRTRTDGAGVYAHIGVAELVME